MSEIKMKSYRPFITQNFFWDFPTHFNLKAVSEFLGMQIDPTTEYISNTAKVIMRNEGIYWFLNRKHHDEIVAEISLSDLDLNQHSAALMVTVKTLTNAEKQEIADRLLSFVKDQLALKTIKINQLDHFFQENFTNNGYNTSNNNTLKRS